MKFGWFGSNDKLLNCSKTTGLFAVSFPLLIINEKVPDDSLRPAICHLILSAEPDSRAPPTNSEPVLLKIEPLSIDSKVNEGASLALSATEAVA